MRFDASVVWPARDLSPDETRIANSVSQCLTELRNAGFARWGDWSGEIVGRVYGLHAPTCECGNERTPYVVTLTTTGEVARS